VKAGRAMPKKRVVIVANKWWECDPIMSVLLNDRAHPAAALGWPDMLNHPRQRPVESSLPSENAAPVPRASFAFKKTTVEIWCISDLLEHLPDKPYYQSSVDRKIEQIPKIFKERADFVVAIGTAAFPSDVSENGNVVVGTKVFMHNAHPSGTNAASQWDVGPFDKVVDSPLDQSAFIAITPPADAANYFLVPPLNPAGTECPFTGYSNVALGTVNVTDDKEYSQKDLETLNAYQSKYDHACAKSLETTHGLIRVQSEAPFIFISGLANRMGQFTYEVKPRMYAQNTTAAHNAGIVLAQMIPKIDSLF
jgi:hypothetical protein